MKKYIAPIAAVLVFFAIASTVAFKPSDTDVVREYATENGSFSVSDGYYTKTWNDTITNTESNTLSVPASLVSPYQYGVTTVLTNISGTRSIKINLDESASATGTDWLSIDSVTVTGTSTGPTRLAGGTLYGRRHRIRLTGTTGTMAVKYTVIANYKKRE